MIVLDTNVVSELMRRDVDPSVLAWLDGHAHTDCFITAVTAAELRFGVDRLPDGRRKGDLTVAVASLIDIDFDERVLPFDVVAAEHFGDIASARERAGRPIADANAQIAAICRSHGATLATRNIRDFAELGLTIINPWT